MKNLVVQGDWFNSIRHHFGSLCGGIYGGTDTIDAIIVESVPEEGDIHPQRAKRLDYRVEGGRFRHDDEWHVVTPGGVHIGIVDGDVVVEFCRCSEHLAAKILQDLGDHPVRPEWLSSRDGVEWIDASDALELHIARCAKAEELRVKLEAMGECFVFRQGETVEWQPAFVAGSLVTSAA